MKNHQPHEIDQILGLYNRRKTTDAGVKMFGVSKPGFLSEAINVKYVEDAVTIRGDVRIPYDATASGYNITRFHLYSKIAGDRYIVLGSNGNIYDYSVSTSVAILSTTGWTDFSGITLYDRFYFCGHNREVGDSGSKGFLYVYDGTTARKAAGAKPASAITVAVSATAGNIELGNRYWFVAYETDTGHITKPNATGTLFNQNVASRKADISVVPTGPAGTAKRHILCTRRVDPNTGRQDDYEVFFIPNAVINDNVTTTITVNFYDNDLIDSADYLFDEFEEVPAFCALAHFSGRLCGSAPAGYTGVVRASKQGFPESFSEIDGFMLVDPSDNGNVHGLLPTNGNLFHFKDDRTYMASDTGDEPASWPVIQIDSGHGCGVFGVAKILDSEGPSDDIAFIATKAGLHAFNGSYPEIPLTRNIDQDWQPFTESDFRNIQVIVNPLNKEIYISISSLDTSDKTYLLVGDYKNGLSWDKIRWSKYSGDTGVKFNCLGPSIQSDGFYLYFSSTDAKLRAITPYGTIEGSGDVVDTPSFTLDYQIPFSGVSHFVGLHVPMAEAADGIVFQTCQVQVTFYVDNDTVGVAGPTITLDTKGKYEVIPCNMKCNRLRVKFALVNQVAGGNPFLVGVPIIIYHKPCGILPISL